MIQGLDNKTAASHLLTYGYNELQLKEKRNLFRIVADFIKEPMFILLIVCSLLYIILGDYREGVILFAATLLVISITFFQSKKTEKALESLKNLSSPRALVLREGLQKRIPGREVVPDDIILLREGDRIAADASLLDYSNLLMDESLLTGESIAVEKNNFNTIVYSGTLILKGSGMAKVCSTGSKTKIGKIGTSLVSIQSDETRLQKELKMLIRNLFLIGMILSMLVIFAFYFTRHSFIQSLLNGLSTSMAILPEEFPVILTIFLAIGAWRLSKNNVLTRKPSAIETLGATTFLCVDKTGTITQNKMHLASIFSTNQYIEEKDFTNNSQLLFSIVQSAYYASSKNSIDPMEVEITNIFKEKQYNEIIGFEYCLVKEYPFSNQFPCMSLVYEKRKGDSVNNESYFIFTKGAPEFIFDLCQMSQVDKETHKIILSSMANKALRVIGVAEATAVKGELPNDQTAFDFKFKGLIGFEDPIRPEVPAAIKECLTAGIKIIIITGDFPLTAESIAKKIGLPLAAGIITGEILNKFSEKELSDTILSRTVFARVLPEQKLRIVNILKSKNEVVAMTGDGVNDAPALKSADIGIAMGNRGTDVAREASSLVLLDDNFASIVSAIKLGRKIFDNLQKAMSYVLAIHIPIIGLTLLPAFFPAFPIILMPLHIVFLELIIDPICAIAFESQEDERNIMTRPPRNPSIKFFGSNKILLSITKGTLLLITILAGYFFAVKQGHSVEEIRAITYTALIFGNFFLILSSLSFTSSFFYFFLGKNRIAKIILLVSTIVFIIILNSSLMQEVFSFKNPGILHFIPIMISTLTFLLVLEVLKYLMKKNRLTTTKNQLFH